MKIVQFAECVYQWLNDHKRPVVPLLQKGLELSEVMNFTDELNITLTNELVELYKWRNGTDKSDGYILGDVDFFPGYHFLPLEHSVAYYKSFINDRRWSKNWFPVFANGGGDFFIINCTDKFKESSEVIGFMRDFDDHEVEYLSLERMLQTFCECYTKGAFYLNGNGDIESKVEEEAIISNKLNPGLDRW
ncbi:MAG: SMI1/KNR4 family protein [Bacteroidota bacterium]